MLGKINDELLTMLALTNDLNIPVVWLIVIGIVGIGGIIWFFVHSKKKQDKVERNFQKRYSGKNIRFLDKYTVFRAQESHGYSQSGGRGYLVLTDDELYFEMILLSKVLSIPVTSITKVGQTNRLGGRNPGTPMLKVEFEDSNGNNDSIALSVKELAMWKKEITTAMSENA